jgi:hypothetical protein
MGFVQTFDKDFSVFVIGSHSFFGSVKSDMGSSS